MFLLPGALPASPDRSPHLFATPPLNQPPDVETAKAPRIGAAPNSPGGGQAMLLTIGGQLSQAGLQQLCRGLEGVPDPRSARPPGFPRPRTATWAKR